MATQYTNYTVAKVHITVAKVTHYTVAKVTHYTVAKVTHYCC